MTNKEAAISIINKLQKAGFQALLAGGCVRDMLLKRDSNDYDVATDAVPKQVIKLFNRTIKVGAKFGVVIVLIDKQQVEVATFRSEWGYADGRHPGRVRFSSAQQDALRRDFTINGMFYDPMEEKVIDYVKGQADLERKIIRTIGKASERFAEDNLRMLRAVRFSTQLGFEIDPPTWQAIRNTSANIKQISGERICIELKGILKNARRPKGAQLLIESSLADAIFDGYSEHAGSKVQEILAELPEKDSFELYLCGFFGDSSSKFIIDSCRILKLSRRSRRHLKFLAKNRSRLLDAQMSQADLRLLGCEPYFEDLFDLQKAIQTAGGESIEPLEKIRLRLEVLKDRPLCPQPLLDGNELINLGARQGPSLGMLAKQLYRAQLEEKVKTKEQAQKWAQKWLSKRRKREKGSK